MADPDQEPQGTESAADRFEVAWQKAARSRESLPSIPDFLPDKLSPDYRSVLTQLIEIDLNYRWLDSGSVQTETAATGSKDDRLADTVPGIPLLRLDDYLEQFPVLKKDGVPLEIICIEYQMRLHSEEAPDSDAYIAYGSGPEEKERIQQALSRVEREAKRTASRTEMPIPTIDGFDIDKTLGHGGMGVVYKARQLSANRLVALKVIRPDRLTAPGGESREEIVNRFRNEVRAAANLEHRHVVAVYEVGDDPDLLYYTMRLVEGGSLAEILKEGPVGNRRAARYIHQAAEAIAAAHAHGILHRDLKPQNILVDSETDEVLLTDFGLAKFAESDQQLTAADDIVGTPAYMSPEQASGSTAVGPATDIYSLGATLYHLITGRPPFQAATAIETLRQVQEYDPISPTSLNPAIDKDLETICLKCLEKEPLRRFEKEDTTLVDELGRYLRGDVLRIRPVSRTERTLRWAKKNPAVARLSFAVVLSLLIGIAVSTYFMFDAQKQAKLLADEKVEVQRQSKLLVEQRDRELDLTRQHAAATNFKTFQMARQRGNWQLALESLNLAEEYGFEDVVLLDIERCRLYTLLDRIEERRALQHKLLNSSDTFAHRGEIILLEAESQLLGGTQKDGIELVRDAIATGLPTSSDAFARALVADSIDEAIELLYRNMDDNSSDPATMRLLCFELFLAGRRDEARKISVLAQTLFPDDVNFAFLESMIDAAEGHRKQATDRLADGTRETAAQRANFTEIILLMSDVRELCVAENSLSALVPVVLRFTTLLKQVQPSPTSLRLVGLPRHSKLMLALSAALLASVNPFADLDEDSWATVERINPEGTTLLAWSMLHSRKAEWSQMESVAVRATELPAIFPEISQRAWTYAAQAAFAQKGNDPQAMERAMRYAGNRRSLGPLTSGEALDFAMLYFSNEEHETAHFLAMEAARAEPDSQLCMTMLVTTSISSGNYFQGLSALDRLESLGVSMELLDRKRTEIMKQLSATLEGMKAEQM